MNNRFITHDTFVIEKTYDTSPNRVFTAWSNPEVKANWYPKAEEFDFQIGGKESIRSGPRNGPIFTFDARYHEIVPDQRIVYSYTMDLDETRISVSLASVEFKRVTAGTHLIYTEQGAFLDGHDTVEQREHGMKIILEKLGKELQRKDASANNKIKDAEG